MNDYKLSLDLIPWINPSAGLRYKEYIKDSLKLRLVEFSDGFIEHDWCKRGHLGIVVAGRATVVFDNGKKAVFSEGDIINIPSGDYDRHKTVINDGDSIRVLFFDMT